MEEKHPEWFNEVDRRAFESLLKRSQREDPEVFMGLLYGLNDHLKWILGLLDRLDKESRVV